MHHPDAINTPQTLELFHNTFSWSFRLPVCPLQAAAARTHTHVRAHTLSFLPGLKGAEKTCFSPQEDLFWESKAEIKTFSFFKPNSSYETNLLTIHSHTFPLKHFQKLSFYSLMSLCNFILLISVHLLRFTYLVIYICV